MESHIPRFEKLETWGPPAILGMGHPATNPGETRLKRAPSQSESLAPGRLLRPTTDSILGPGCGLVPVTGSACVRNSVLVRHRWGAEAEGVSANKRSGNPFRLDRGHVAGNAIAASAAVFVVRVFFESGRVRSIRGGRTMTIKADLVRRLS